MDKKQKLTYQKDIQSYLTTQHIYDLFQNLLQSLIVKQPQDPYTFLIDKLSSNSSENQIKKVFLVGPPGFKVREFALQVADHYKFTTISVGDLLKKEVNKKLQLGEEIESYFKNFSLVKDEIVINLVKKQIQTIQKQKKSFILSGFPKTRAQGLAMQKAGIFPDAFLIINMDQDRMSTYCQYIYSLSILGKSLNPHKKSSTNPFQLTNLNIFKIIYSNISSTLNKQEILEDIARLLKYKIKNKRPKRPAAILIMGGNKGERVEVSKKLAKRYGFTYISARELLIEQVGKSSEVGRLALEKIRQNQLIDDSIINGLIQNRLSQVDCQMQGYVLQGYPKTPGQVKALNDTHLKPSLIVSIHGGKISQQVTRQINEKFENSVLKISGQSTNQQIFEKVCFELENN